MFNTWSWTDGSDLDYGFNSADTPTGTWPWADPPGSGASFVVLLNSGSGWNDYDGHHLQFAICEGAREGVPSTAAPTDDRTHDEVLFTITLTLGDGAVWNETAITSFFLNAFAAFHLTADVRITVVTSGNTIEVLIAVDPEIELSTDDIHRIIESEIDESHSDMGYEIEVDSVDDREGGLGELVSKRRTWIFMVGTAALLAVTVLICVFMFWKLPRRRTLDAQITKLKQYRKGSDRWRGTGDRQTNIQTLAALPISTCAFGDPHIEVEVDLNSDAASQKVSEVSDAQSFSPQSQDMELDDDLYSVADPESAPMTQGVTLTGGNVVTPTVSDV